MQSQKVSNVTSSDGFSAYSLAIAYPACNWGFETTVFYGVGMLTLCPQPRGSRLYWSLFPEGNTFSGSSTEARLASVTLVVVTLQ
jgi:hypothetical protein